MVEKFGDLPDKAKKRKANPGLALALAAALQAAAPATAEAQQVAETRLSFAPKLSAPARAEAYYPGMEEDPRPIRIKGSQRIETVRAAPVTAEKVAEEISELEMQLAPGGPLNKKLHSESLTKQELNDIVARISRVSGLAAQVDANLIPQTSAMDPYTLRDTPRSLVYLDLPVRITRADPHATEKTDAVVAELCGAGRYTYRGKTALVTARHCVYAPEHGLEAVEGDWFYLASGSDVAIKMIPAVEDDMSAQLDDDLAKITEGRFASMDAHDRYGQRVHYYTFLLPATLPVLNIIFPNGEVEEQKKLEMLQGFWYPAPPDQQMQAIDTAQRAANNELNAHGTSGTPFFVRIGTAFAIAGPSYAARLPVDAKDPTCIDNVRGLCTTIGFAATPQSIIDLFKTYDMAVESGSFKPKTGGEYTTKTHERYGQD